MRQFIKSADLVLLNGGYLSEKGSKAPVFNAEFVAAQKRAEYVVTFAKLAKGKDFVGKKADSIEDLKAVLNKELAVSKPQYIDAPEKVTRKLTDSLAKEAMAFIRYTDNSVKNEKVNEFLQEFNVLNDFEEFGLFFEDDIVKLNKIYTMDEIIQAVQETIDLLD